MWFVSPARVSPLLGDVGLNAVEISSAQYSMVCWLEHQLSTLMSSTRFLTPGTVVFQFFWCMGTLFNHVDRTRRGIKWGLVTHTVATSSSVTMHTAVTLDLRSISCTDQQRLPGDGVLLPEPMWYKFVFHSVIPNVPVEVS